MSSPANSPVTLVYMANQIGKFFATQKPGGDVDGVATHIRKFWDPRMRREMYQHIDLHQAEGLKPIVLEALTQHRSELN